MSDSDSRLVSPLPEAGRDPADPNQPMEEDRDTPPPPVADPAADMDNDLSDNDSVLSDVDEAQFADFDPANIAIEERPIAVDEDTAKLLVAKRKRDRDGEDKEGEPKKKKKERRREKPKKKRRGDDDDNFSGGEELEGKRKRKSKPVDGEEGARKKERPRAQPEPENEEALDPEESELMNGYNKQNRVRLTHAQDDEEHSIEPWMRRSRTPTGVAASKTGSYVRLFRSYIRCSY